MKKALGIVLTMAMLMSFSSFAALSVSGETSSTTVSYTIEPVYSVSIPPAIPPEEEGGSPYITANVDELPSDMQVTVTISSWSQKEGATDNNEHIYLTNGTAYIPFELRVNGTKTTLATGNNKVLTAISDEAVEPANITIERIDDEIYVPGTYSGNINFHIELENKDGGIEWVFPEDEDDGVLLPPIMS